MAKLNKRELQYLAPAVLYGWRIEKFHFYKQGRWDGDYLMPVSIGKVAQRLTKLGYFDKVDDKYYDNAFFLRATEKAKKLKCKACRNGWVLSEDDDCDDREQCSACSGIGLVNSQGCNRRNEYE